MIEIFLEILTAVFAVFGLYAFASALSLLIFEDDNIGQMLLVDSAEVASGIELYLSEARGVCVWLGGKRLTVIIEAPYATPELLEILNKKRIPYEIVHRV